MSYQVLARKWRPAQFADVVGQSHVVAALSNALDQDRVHHAFLFTGTRGVGKTTLARIFAKALNCEQGVSSHPCGECSACVSVAEGRFIDLIEVDAASKTKVDDTRELLENVQYAPTQGRYKVYLIDEVHMLSTHSFNALLKTLEEPPEHVKFLLATTDPQKLPMTVLSRCIQFSLNAIEVPAIEAQLKMILDDESMPYEQGALTLLARSADGSLRDALSLLDQAIAYSQQNLTTAGVRDMLGLVDGQSIVAIIEALINNDVNALMDSANQLTHAAQDLKTALDELLSYLHALALYQFAPEAIEWKGLKQEDIARLAEGLSAESIQLYYQIVLNGKRDFSLAPDPRTGFEMVLLRLLAFKPGVPSGAAPIPTSVPVSAPVPAAEPVSAPVIEATPQQASSEVASESPSAPSAPHAQGISPIDQARAALVNPTQDAPAPMLEDGLKNDDLQRLLKPASQINAPEKSAAEESVPWNDAADDAENGDEAAQPVDTAALAPAEKSAQAAQAVAMAEETVVAYQAQAQVQAQNQVNNAPNNNFNINDLVSDLQAWSDFIVKTGLSGMARQLAMHMTPISFEQNVLSLQLDQRYANVQSDERAQQIGEILQQYSGQSFKLNIVLGEVASETTAAGVIAERERVHLEKTRDDFKSDDNVQELMNVFDADIDDSSIKPIN
ncbi:MAG: DNA polymerase III subunit gamma/tau [Arenicellales bacterium]